MKNVSNEFKNIIKSGGPFYAYASITLKNGEKVVLDSENDFFISGNGYSEDGGNGFPLGSALSKSITLVIDNLDERYSNYDFYYAQISLHTEADVSSGTERLLEGTFTVLEPTAVGDTIELVGYDDMHKADIDFSSKLSYPTTAGQLLREVCNTCDISLGSPTFKNQDYSIKNAPEKVTCREVIGYIAQIAVGNAIIQNGTLTIKSYDFSPIANITKKADLKEGAGYCILENYPTDPDIGTDPVTITGIATTKKEENKSTILLRGTEDYALEITNPLIEGNEEEALQLIGEVLIGSHMRSFSGEFFPDPTIEFMDLVCVVDRKEKVYPTFVTSNEFNYLGNSQLSCGIKDPERQKSTYYSEATKIYEQVKKDVQNTKTEFEEAVENLNKTLENASGMYATEVTQPDGSTITYIHDKPTVEESKNVIKITSEAIGISNDGGKTYPYGLFLTGDLITRILYTVGINADYINSGSIIVKDKNGNITFYADTETGRVVINAESVTITGKSVSEIAGEKADEKVDNFVNNVYKADQESVQKQIDGKVETWLQPTDPSVNWGETSETEWSDIDGSPIKDVSGNSILLTVESGKALHEGDLWKNSDTNVEYRYQDGQWVEMKVPDEVFDEIDGKAQIFVETPYTPYRVGDLWFDSDTSDIMTCTTTRLTGNFVSSDWEKRNKYTDDSELNSFVTAVYDPAIAKLQAQIDGQIETWYYDYEPSLQNEPAVNWTTTEERKQHEGDLFYWKSKGYAYRFLQDGAAWKWQLLQDADITKALAAAEKAQDTADHKRRVFVVTPQPPYDIGDLWVQGDGGDIMRCCVARSESASFSASDWEKASKYTDDTRANEVKAELDVLGKDLQNQIDGKIETYNQAEDPSGAWTTDELKAQHKGDLWYSPKEEVTRRWNGTSWEKLSDADAKAANNLAMTKKRVFSVTPYPPYDVDDLWVQGENGDLMRCVNARQTGSYDSTDWVRATKYTDDTAIKNFINNTYAGDLDSIKNQLDQKVETWYQESDPSVNWRGTETWPWSDINGNSILDVSGNEIQTTVETEKALHDGDLWHCTKDNSEYIYSSGEWHDKSIPDEVFDKIDGKSSIYAAQPNPPYEQNDLWFTGTEILVCIKTRETGSFESSDWVKKDSYTDDSALNNFLNGDYSETIEEIKTQVDGKAETWRQDSDPSSAWTTAELKAQHKGDLWYKISEQKSYIYTGSGWQEMKTNPPDEVFDSIDGKAQIFSKTPTTPYDVGDLYFTGTDILICKTARKTGQYNASDWEKKDNYTDDSTIEDFIKNTYDPKIADIQTQLDGKIETWFYDYEPTLSNLPAKDWTTDDIKAQHNGDLFFWQSKGYTYRFLKVDSAWKWQLIQDEDINNAMKAASKAQDTADGKRRVFTTTPTPPYDVGDLWTQGSTGDLMRCSTARASGNYNSSDWVLATKYTDDTVANKAIAQIEVLDGKINLKVTADDVASIIEQKADSIRLKANKISWKSTYSSMTENGVLTCQGANINGTVNTVSSNRKAEMSGGYTRYYWGDKLLGHIGTNCTKSNNNVQGLVFDLDYDGWYMSWSYKESPNADAYSMKLTYASGEFDNFSKDTLHVGCNMDMHGWTLKNPSFEGGGVTGILNFTQITNMKSDGNCTYANGCKMQFKNGILIAGTWNS